MVATWFAHCWIVVASSFATAAPIGGDCANCSLTALCAPHQKEEAAAVAGLAAKLKSKDPFDRKATVDKLAELDHARPLGPSAEIAKLVAGTLDDDNHLVRLGSVQALAAKMHPDVAVPALCNALNLTMKALAKMPYGRADWGGGGGAGAGEDNPPPEDPKAIEKRKQRDELNTLAQELVNALTILPDDRSVTALMEMLPQLSRWHEALLTSTAGALVKLRARKGIEVVVQRIKLSPIGDSGSKWGGPDKTGATLRDVLARGLEDAGSEPVPPWSDEEAPDWERWFAKNQKHFLAKLGKLTVEAMQMGDEAGAN
ncbi:MAG: hypothetical protein EXS13_08810 [Planctomycetes bacterium]|nr:hypothetical protein [Planctomycetota bacterium]